MTTIYKLRLSAAAVLLALASVVVSVVITTETAQAQTFKMVYSFCKDLFTVVSASEITTTVPAGATTGTVQVVTPVGTLSSNNVYSVK
jgi:hypothetical protein